MSMLPCPGIEGEVWCPLVWACQAEVGTVHSVSHMQSSEVSRLGEMLPIKASFWEEGLWAYGGDAP